MIESVTFRVLEEMGAVKKTKKILMVLGTERFGKPTREQKQKLDAIEDMNRLDRLVLRVLKVNDWDALLKGR